MSGVSPNRARLMQRLHDVTMRRMHHVTGHRAASTFRHVFPKHEEFSTRHNGPDKKQQKEMLNTLGVRVSLSVLFRSSKLFSIWFARD